MPDLATSVTSEEIKRIFDKVNIPVDKNETECWTWNGALEKAGYGSFNFRGSTVRASRLIWFIYRGLIPDHLMVLHKCNNKACVNVNHLYLGDHSNNTIDAFEDGAMPAGERHHFAKFSNDRVEQIKLAIFSGSYSQKELASMFDCSQTYISRLANNKRRRYDNMNNKINHTLTEVSRA